MKGYKMNIKCDKCENKARFTMSGYVVGQYLCAMCAANVCLELGDHAGYSRFLELAIFN